MSSLLLFSVIFGILLTLITVPLFHKSTKESPSSFSLFKLIGSALIFTFIIFGVYYLTNLDRNVSSIWFFLLTATIIGTVLSTGKERMVKGILFLGTLIFSIFLLTAFLFNADEKFNQAKMKEEVEIEAFDESVTPASVPPQFARNKMKKAFGQVPNTSYYELGNLQIQNVNDQYVYIAPVEFSGLFKWIKGKETPGYFTMSATDTSSNPVFMDTPMTFTPSSYFHQNVDRKIRNAYPERIFYGDVQLEINDEGEPFYIQTYGEFISARNGFTPLGIVMINPSSGEVSSYTFEETPEFIDGAISPEAVSLQNSYYGNYIEGYWNSIFGKTNVKLPSDEGTEANVSPVFMEDGEMYYFTDFTSPKEGVDSMLGYSLTNGRTGKATYYTGNLEESYMDSYGALQIIEKKFIEKKWSGEMPILYNFYGEASWLTPVLDSNGFFQNYFIVSAANPEISAYATTPKEALKKYKVALQRGGSSVDGSSNAEELSITGNVTRVFKETSGDYVLVYFLLDNGSNYVVSAESNPLSIYLQEGDEIRAITLNTGEEFLPIKELVIENLTN
ncbi:membrane protein [Bacillus coahuilensis m2-6]|uniref:hypothetical protein n=1 Tax=Bacillus coahuilensis TaxID=408580 RepID=UPI0007501C70|nr:hypothetical protein [Bacillus coahuilensis]KUP09521.1 membrane protein [Bacillus coahuilensis m2-6]